MKEGSIAAALRARPSNAFAQIDAHDVLAGQRLLGRAGGDDAAGVEDDDVAAERADGVHDVLDHQDGHAVLGERMHQGDAGLELGRVEVGQPLVEQQQVGGAGD
jgi:hypothetical protein